MPVDQDFIDDTIRQAQEAGIYPAEGQRPVDWPTVKEWADRCREPGFKWLPTNEQSGEGYIIVGKNKAVASGQHRILGGLAGRNPVPNDAIDEMSIDLPTQPWK